MVKLFLVLLMLMPFASAQAQGIDYVSLEPPVEMRAIWLDAGAIPKTPEAIRSLLRTYHRANINLIFPEVIARGYTVYPSKLIPRDPRFVGAPDVLDILIREAHALGMEVHPWVWVFRAGYTNDKGAILSAHPDWAELSREGKELSPNGGYWISPVVPEARDFLARLFAELVSQYDVDGIHLDYIRYENETSIPYGYSGLSREVFRRQYGVEPLEIDKLSFHQYEWEKFRERQVNTFVQRIFLQTRFLKPQAKVSAAVGPDPNTARIHLMQNWAHWIDNKWVDFIVPMAYSSDDNHFRGLVTRQKDAVGGKTLLAPGIGFFAQKDVRQMVNQIGITRELNAAGQALFASSYFKDSHAGALSTGPYELPAAQPFRNPRAQSRKLLVKAGLLSKQGKEAEAAYCAAQAAILSDYATYQEAVTGYVPPTPPPIEIPAYVVPLPEIEARRASGQIRIDGRLDDEGWANAATAQLIYTNTGDDAPVKTTVRLTYDSSSIYIGFDSVEPEPGKMKALADMRDGPVFQDDSVEVFIDPTDRRKEYYHLATNSVETKFDQKVTSAAWNGDWRTASRVGATGWTTEIAIPFSTLEVTPPARGTRWALNLTRNRTVSGTLEHFTWAVPYGSFHNPERFGAVVFR